MITSMQRFLCTENGSAVIEYGLIAALVVAVIIGSVQALGQSVVNALWAPVVAAFNG